MGPNHAPRRSGAGALRDLLVISLCAAVLFDLGVALHVFERAHRWVEGAPRRAVEVFAVYSLLALGFAAFAVRRWREAGRQMAARAEAEQRHRALVEQIPAITYTWDPTKPAGTVPAPYISPQIESVLGFTPEEWRSDPKTWLRQIHPEDYDRVVEASDRADRTGEPFDVEYRMIAKDGRVVWIRDQAVVVEWDEFGRPRLVQGVMYDITERRRAEERLREAEARYRTLVERVPAVTYIWDSSHPTGTVSAPYISPQIESMLGFTPEEWQADPMMWHRQVHPEDLHRVLARWEISDRDGSPFSSEYRMFAKDGRAVWIRDEAVAVSRDEHGRPLFQGVMFDITERRRAEERLREAEARYRTLVEQLPAVVYVDAVDDLSTALYVSPQYERLLGYSAEERMADPELWLRRLHPEDRDRVAAESLRTNETGEPFMSEYRLLHKDGDVVWVRDEAVLVRDADGRPLYWQGVLLNITERKRAEETLHRREAILQAVGFAAERFLLTGSWEDGVHEVLERLGQAAGASRVYVFENEHDEDGALLMTQLHEWVAPGIRPTMGHPSNTRFPYRAGGFGRWEDELGAGRAIHGTRADLPGAERQDMEDEDILSMAVVPVFVGDEWWGFVGFDDCLAEREWSRTEIDALKAAADTLGAAIGRERAEARLQEAEAQYRTLVERIPAVVYFAAFGEAAPWLYVSPQVEAVLGYSAEEWMARPDLWTHLIHPDDLERVLREENHSRETGEPLVSEYRMIARDGRVVWIRDEAEVVRGEDDDRGHLRGIMYDITARRQAEEQLHEAEVKYRTLVEQLPAAAYIDALDPEAATLYISPQIESILGYRPEEWTSDPRFWSEHLHPDDRDRAVAGNIAHNETGRPFEMEYRMIARDGRVVWIRDQAVLVRDENEEPRFSQGIMADITEQKQAEELLRETEARYRALVEQIPAVLYIDLPDEDLTPVYVSPQVESLLGVPPDRYVNEDLWAELVHPDDRERAVRESLEGVASNAPFSLEYRMVTADGRVLWIHDHSVVLRDEEGRPTLVQGVMSDITERKLAEEALQESERREREAAERLRSLDEMKNTFLAAVSHELRSPLTSILGLALTLEQQRLPQQDQADLLSRLAFNARKLDRLLKDLLDIDRLNRGIVAPQSRPTDMAALVRRTVESLELPAGRSVLVEADPVVAEVDPAKVERIVENLLVNATRHTTSNAGVWVRVLSRDGGVLIAVEDDGPGVPPELRREIFEPFRQGPTASPHAPGTGIGLSLVKMFAELHGGRAWVEDREGGGASFRVFLPGVVPDPNGGPEGNGEHPGKREATTLDPAGAG